MESDDSTLFVKSYLKKNGIQIPVQSYKLRH